MLCHNCKTEMIQTDISTLAPERLDKLLSLLDDENFFPKVVNYINSNKDLKVNILKKGYFFYLCPKDGFFIFEKNKNAEKLTSKSKKWLNKKENKKAKELVEEKC